MLSAQSELLKNLSKLLWQFELLNIDVSFYKSNGNETAYRKAAEKYQNESAGLLGGIRAELSTSRRLVSPGMCLEKLYCETLLQIDRRLEWLIRNDNESLRDKWLQQHDASFNIAQKQIDHVLNDLASELQLSAPAATEHRTAVNGSPKQ